MSLRRTPAFYTARGYRTTAQSIPNDTSTVVLWTAERYDVGGFHDNSTNTGRFYPPVPGYYICVATLQFNGAALGNYRAVYLNHQPSDIDFGYVDAPPLSTIDRRLTAVGAYYFAFGDYAQVKVYQDSTGSLDLEVAAGLAPEFTIAFAGE